MTYCSSRELVDSRQYFFSDVPDGVRSSQGFGRISRVKSGRIHLSRTNESSSHKWLIECAFAMLLPSATGEAPFSTHYLPARIIQTTATHQRG